MDREQIIRMAREAGFVGFDGSNAMLCKFAALVAAHKREWVGLTDGDIAQTMHGSVEGSNMLPYQFARAIEAKLKEKNT